MKRWPIVILVTVLALILATAALSHWKRPTHPNRPAPSGTQRFITVQPDVELEVLDFGGTGRSVVLLAGLGDTAHVFANFATKLTPTYHVLAITRRGFGLSSAPASGYTAKRLGDDVVEVIDMLHLARPILAGHSMAGEELSSVATFHPEKIAGLIYLDAGYGYALHDQIYGNREIRVATVVSYIEPLIPAVLENPRVAIIAGQRKFEKLPVPVLAFFATPHDLSAEFKDTGQLAKEEEKDLEHIERQIGAFQRQVPLAKIVRLPHASHTIYRSNEAEVVNQVNAFISSLH